MTRRKQNLVLFFEEKMEKISINNRLVRSHMNHLTIGEIAEIEIIAAYNIHENEQIEPLAQEAVEISKRFLLEKTDTHFISGSVLKSTSAEKSLSFSMPRNIQEYAQYYFLILFSYLLHLQRSFRTIAYILSSCPN